MDGGFSDVRPRKQTRLTDFWKPEESIDGAVSYVQLGTKKPQLQDRLSELPESMLIKILSLLDMTEAVKTGILSTRWKLLWTKVDSIVYRGTYHHGTQEECNRIFQKYISFIDRTIMQCTSSSIKCFRFRNGSSRPSEFPNDKAMHEMLNKWLNFILQKNVEVFKLKLEGLEYHVPNCLYRNTSLINLKLKSVHVSVSSPVSWCLLRSLHFVSVKVDDESFATVLLGCPVLETIVLDCFGGIKNLNIMSPTVKKLILRNPEHSDDDFVEVNAPWLQELELGSGDFFIRHFQLADLSSLKSAELCFFYYEDWRPNTTDPNGLWWNEMVEGIFKSLCHVTELTISTEIIQAFALSKLLGKHYPKFMCKHVTVHVPLWKYDLYGMACLLQNAPYLETLYIKVAKWQHHEIMPYPKDNFDKSVHKINLPEGHLMHLKYVKIEYERYWNHSLVPEDGEECLDFELVEYILRSSSVLEKFVITSSGRGWCSECRATTCSSRHVPSLSSKLLLIYLVGNETLEWELLKENSTFEFRFTNYMPLHTKSEDCTSSKMLSYGFR